ncbi:MAG: ice-binding family protein [Thermoplasmata archaeon]
MKANLTPGVVIAVSALILGSIVFATIGFAGIPLGGSATSQVSSPPESAGAVAGSGPSCGQVAVPLASAASYAVLASSTVTSTGATSLTGNLGLSPGTSVTGFPPATITGIENVTTPSAAAALANLTVAYNNASARTYCPVTVAGNIGGQTLTPGLYKSTSSLAISSGDLTLSGGGNPNAVFIFQVASSLTTTSGRSVILSDGAQASNVFWQVGSSVTLGTTSVMKGTVMAHNSISMLTGSVLDGRAMAETGEVSLAASTIVVPSRTVQPTFAVTFQESGLPAGTLWSVSLAGVPTRSTSATIGFLVVSGSYSFTTTVKGFIATPAYGHLTVAGAPVTQAIVCAAGVSGTVRVTFTESGLPSGTSWSVTMNGATVSSGTTSVGFSEGVGTYSYRVGVVSNFTANPSVGSVLVNGTPTGPGVAFSSVGGPSSPPAPTAGSSGISSGDWALIIVGAVVAVAAVGTVIVVKKRGSK